MTPDEKDGPPQGPPEGGAPGGGAPKGGEGPGLDTMIEIFDQINQLSGAALDALTKGRKGSGSSSGAPEPDNGAPPAPPAGA